MIAPSSAKGATLTRRSEAGELTGEEIRPYRGRRMLVEQLDKSRADDNHGAAAPIASTPVKPLVPPVCKGGTLGVPVGPSLHVFPTRPKYGPLHGIIMFIAISKLRFTANRRGEVCKIRDMAGQVLKGDIRYALGMITPGVSQT